MNMITKKNLNSPIDHTSLALPTLFEKMAIGKCSVKNFENEVILDLSQSGFTAIKEEIMSFQGEIIFKTKAIQELQVETTENDELIMWIKFSPSSQLEIQLLPTQSKDFWNLLKCLEMDISLYERGPCITNKTGKCPCCVKRIDAIKSATEYHPVAMMLSEISNGEIGTKTLEIELGDESCRVLNTMETQSTRFEEGIAKISGNGEVSLNLAAIHSIRVYKENIDQSDHMSLVMYSSYAEVIYKVTIPTCSPFNRWKGFLDTMYNYEQ